MDNLKSFKNNGIYIKQFLISYWTNTSKPTCDSPTLKSLSLIFVKNKRRLLRKMCSAFAAEYFIPQKQMKIRFVMKKFGIVENIILLM